jgi:hypothetical protein
MLFQKAADLAMRFSEKKPKQSANLEQKLGNSPRSNHKSAWSTITRELLFVL